jgi:putative transcriptional regulator
MVTGTMSAVSCCTSASASPYTSTLAIPGGLEMTHDKDCSKPVPTALRLASCWVTLGCSGWVGRAQLEEIGRNGWLTVSATPEVIFDTPIEQRYDRALSLLGIDPRMLSQEAGHA